MSAAWRARKKRSAEWVDKGKTASSLQQQKLYGDGLVHVFIVRTAYSLLTREPHSLQQPQTLNKLPPACMVQHVLCC